VNGNASSNCFALVTDNPTFTNYTVNTIVIAVLVVVAVVLLLRRRGNWLAGAGWATVALICSLAWLMPWYVIWVLPLAALADSVPLRRVALGFTVFLVLSFVPANGMFMRAHHINLMGSSDGQASQRLQSKLAG